MGDIQGAQQAAADAKKYAMWGAIIAVVVWILYVIFVFVLGFGGALLGGAANMSNIN